MAQHHVAVASLGGTITMTASRDGDGVRPTLSAHDLVAAVPALAEVARLETETLATLPGASLAPADVMDALAWARRAVDRGARGVVLVQGTDTIEETAFLLDLHWERPEPLVVTGAMRSPQVPGSDGPANLLAAVLTARDDRSRDLGVLVVLNDEVHAAARVRKTASTAVGAFQSLPFGPLAHVQERRLAYGNRPPRWPPLTGTPDGSGARVALLETCLGDQGELLDLVVSAEFDGVVLAGFGVGHVSAALAHRVDAATRTCPVVLATRTGSGPTATATYGFVGSESDLIARGAVPAGWLDPRKARLLLWSLLISGASAEEVETEFRRRGGSSMDHHG